MSLPTALTEIGQNQLRGILYPVFFLVAAVALNYYAMNATPLGRYLYSIGGSKDASRLSGLNVPRLTFAFVASGFMAGVAGGLPGDRIAGRPVAVAIQSADRPIRAPPDRGVATTS